MIFRPIRRNIPFTQIGHELINTPSLSGKAKWILTYILSKPDNWIVYEKDIAKHTKDGRDAIRTGIQKLITTGYIKRKRVRDTKGQFTEYEYRVSELPVFIQDVSKDGKSNIGESAPSNINTSRHEKVQQKIQENKWQAGEIQNPDIPE